MGGRAPASSTQTRGNVENLKYGSHEKHFGSAGVIAINVLIPHPIPRPQDNVSFFSSQEELIN
jgi:hypothetical protein